MAARETVVTWSRHVEQPQPREWLGAGGLWLVLPGQPLPCLCMASGERHLVCILIGFLGSQLEPAPPGVVPAKPPPLAQPAAGGLTPLIFPGCAQGQGCHRAGARTHLAPTSSFPLSRVPAGVPGCAGQTHGSGWEPSQAGSVDQCLPGCPGKDPAALGCKEGPPTPGSCTAPGAGGDPHPWVPHSPKGHVGGDTSSRVQLETLTLGSHTTPECRWMGTPAPGSCTAHAPSPLSGE